MEDLIVELGRPASLPERKSGLFQELLLSRPEAMYVDSLEHPEKYDERVLPLLRELSSSRREPTAKERLLLDEAVIDFIATPKDKPPPPAPKPRVVVQEESIPDLENEFFAETSAPGSAIPNGGELKPFWWL